jgi:phosphopantothenoylcysteine decarboxylase/phosphopantothenate--cysteine ligase
MKALQSLWCKPLATLTIRNLPDAVRDQLRLRAAKHGRSMEEEIRLILAGAGVAPQASVSALSRPAAPARTSLSITPAGSPAPSQPISDAARGSRVLLIIGGGIAAYKSLDLIRRLRERGASVRVVMTKAAQEFVTPLAAGALAGGQVYTDLFDTVAEFDVGHIRLAREADLVVVAPATADLMAKIANGHGDDLASTILLATTAPVLIAPAMNPQMWAHPATQRNLARLRADGIATIGPNAGEMAETGEAGTGRMSEPLEIAQAALALLTPAQPQPLKDKRILITSGPTHEPIDPVRYIANRSSGKQGFAIARAAQAAGASVTLITGPVNIQSPAGVNVLRVETAREMLAAVEQALPADIAIFAAAVADWRVAREGDQKIKKGAAGTPELPLVENPDILATIAQRAKDRPRLVIGFAAETERVIEHAKQKLAKKKCDWILANDVSEESGVMGGDRNTIHLVSASGVEDWPEQSKDDVAAMLVARIVREMA